MVTAVLVLFIVCAFLIFYSYVVFPFILKLLFRKREEDHVAIHFSPSVSIVMSVFNEEKVLREKLDGVLRSDYIGKLEIIIGSDASTDTTNELLKTYAEKDHRINFVLHPLRRGKPAMINDLIARSSGSIVLLTDANVFFEPQTITALVKRFNDPKVGLCGATILNSGLREEGISHQEKSYVQRENLIKYREGEIWGTMMGPFGGCYAIRKELYEPVPSNFLVDDFYISMVVLEKGFKCVQELNAICYEDVSTDVMQEYRRKARISAGNFQNLKRFRKFLLKPFSPTGFCFISHKLLRWLSPFFILLTILCLVILQAKGQFFFWLLIGEIALVMTPLFDFLFAKAGIQNRLLRFSSYFILMNLALLKGFFHFLSGVQSGVWTPTERTVE